ncbi:nuclear transport factor 2 family protein [Aliiglaciecola sp. 2_MG-2023]|uniref:nuclear transport factor 2 family protein n=1 Tax=unclassified Aliiglaciecola TaxID=2593648 RepID=UPI0026E28208|nr:MULTISPECIES: nuclear transport factor 2 family protein [unclassified Aliiglaciecola]MDO6712786.1 nuclear transport factor 2 family protein [Aliiglaciecola sp. 2_MG-2023]MDO6753815.1 nuclear transport factor 2 family protein [Aliiglaciecola sp. 1_MG-2023]
MKLLTILIIALPLFFSDVKAASLTADDYEKAEKYIIESATDWANSVVTGDISKRKIYFAEDFVGTETDGSRYGKKDRINETGPSKVYVSNEINKIKVTFYGETAIVHGDEIWVKKDGSTGRWVWTDVCVRRNDIWQLVAAQDAEAPVSKE